MTRILASLLAIAATAFITNDKAPPAPTITQAADLADLAPPPEPGPAAFTITEAAIPDGLPTPERLVASAPAAPLALAVVAQTPQAPTPQKQAPPVGLPPTPSKQSPPVGAPPTPQKYLPPVGAPPTPTKCPPTGCPPAYGSPQGYASPQVNIYGAVPTPAPKKHGLLWKITHPFKHGQ